MNSHKRVNGGYASVEQNDPDTAAFTNGTARKPPLPGKSGKPAGIFAAGPKPVYAAIAVLVAIIIIGVVVTREPAGAANENRGRGVGGGECIPITGKGRPLTQTEIDNIDLRDNSVIVYKQGDSKAGRNIIKNHVEVPFVQALSMCDTLECVRDAHKQKKEKGQFNFPHFFITGWAKSATTSLHGHLVEHPQILKPSIKELHFVDVSCNYTCDKVICDRKATEDFIVNGLYRDTFVKKKGRVAAFDATPNIITLGQHYAKILNELMPWAKLIVVMREPISRSISRYVHLLDKRNEGCLAHEELSYCLLQDDDLSDPIAGHPYRSAYSQQLKNYLDAFPKSQIMVVQYEDLIGDLQGSELKRVKKFLGIDPSLPEDAEDIMEQSGICRKCKIQPEGWPMEEKVYKQLVEWVKQDTKQVAKLLDKYNLGDSKRWTRNWQKHWNTNLATCKRGMCNIQLS